MANNFKQRTKVPESGNLFYNKIPNGLNTCVYGYPKKDGLDVLSNCVGYVHGRFSEIHFELTGKKENIAKTLNCNAENFIARAETAGLEIGSEPRLGAIMCWQKGTLSSGDGAGHVAIVEKIISSSSVVTSESSYGGSAFYTKTRNKGEDGNWGLAGAYKFRAFIYHPDIKKEEKTESFISKDETSQQLTFEINEEVDFKGGKHYTSSYGTKGYLAKPGRARITKINLKGKHPYHLIKTQNSTSNVYGWVDKNTIE